MPLATCTSRVTVETNLESIAFDRPFLINKSSIGDRQSTGGAGIRTCPNALSKAVILSGFKRFGFAAGVNPDFWIISSQRALLSAENVFLRK